MKVSGGEGFLETRTSVRTNSGGAPWRSARKFPDTNRQKVGYNTHMQTPAAERKVLILIAGTVWLMVGLILSAVGIRWIILAHRGIIIPGLIGLFAGLLIDRWKFSRLSLKNIRRIFTDYPGQSRICVFAFQSTEGYVMIAAMMILGYTLRHLPIDKIYLSPVYLAIGLGLMLSSLQYYRAYAAPPPDIVSH